MVDRCVGVGGYMSRPMSMFSSCFSRNSQSLSSSRLAYHTRARRMVGFARMKFPGYQSGSSSATRGASGSQQMASCIDDLMHDIRLGWQDDLPSLQGPMQGCPVSGGPPPTRGSPCLQTLGPAGQPLAAPHPRQARAQPARHGMRGSEETAALRSGL